MLETVWATVRQGKIEPLELTELLEITKVLITVFPNNDEADFWSQAS